MPHLDAAYNLARWLTGNDHDAGDVVQESVLRAFRFFEGYRGGDARSWLLMITRRTCFSWLEKNRNARDLVSFDEAMHEPAADQPGPEASMLKSADRQMVREAIQSLPPEYREVIVLHEMEGMSYKEVAQVADIPLGTVMSRLSRARGRLERALSDKASGNSKRGPREARHELR